MSKSEFSITTKLARHYDIFEHMFNGEEFTPIVRMSVAFGETDYVRNGNFLTPSQVRVINNYLVSVSMKKLIIFFSLYGGYQVVRHNYSILIFINKHCE